MDFFQVIRLGETETLSEKITDDDLTLANEEGQNLLHEAVAYNRPEIGHILIRKGISLDHQDNEGRTPLHYAAQYRSGEFARMLIENDADPHVTDRHGNSPLWTAVFNAKGNYVVVKILIEAGANANQRNKHGKSPIDFAQQINDGELLTRLQSGLHGNK